MQRTWQRLPRPVQWAVGACAALVLCYLLLVCTGPGQRFDSRFWQLNDHFSRTRQADLSRLARKVLPVIAAALAVLAIVGRRQWLQLIVLAVSWPVAVGGAYALRAALPRPFLGDNGGFTTNSFPSTHVALAVTPLIVMMMVRTWRQPMWWIGAGLCLAAMLGNLMLHVHRASDVFGSALLALAVVAAVQQVVTGRIWSAP